MFEMVLNGVSNSWAMEKGRKMAYSGVVLDAFGDDGMSDQFSLIYHLRVKYFSVRVSYISSPFSNVVAKC